MGFKSSFLLCGFLGGFSSRGRNKFLGDEYLEGRYIDLVYDKNLEFGFFLGGLIEEKFGLYWW